MFVAVEDAPPQGGSVLKIHSDIAAAIISQISTMSAAPTRLRGLEPRSASHC